MNMLRHHRYFIMAILVFASLPSFGCIKKIVAVIDRNTFSLSLPAGWTEDTKDSMYDRDHFVFFQNQEYCLFTVFIGKKSMSASVDSVIMSQKQEMEKRLTDIKSIHLTQWSRYEGKGFEIEGKDQGMIPYRCRIFGFERKPYNEELCVIVEGASLEDFKKYASDFKVIRQTFNLKEDENIYKRK